MDLTPQEPAEGISKMKVDGFYQVECSCGEPTHAITMELENDKDLGPIVHLYSQVTTPYWKERWEITYEEPEYLIAIKQAYNSIYNRIATSLTILFKGYIKMEASVILSKQQAVSFAKLLKDHASK